MTIQSFIKILFLFFVIVSCNDSKIKIFNKVEKTLYSDIFFSKYRLDFLKSDLTKFSFDPRMQFSYPSNNNAIYRVLIFRDSSLRIFGTAEFSKVFNVRIDTFFKSDVILSKYNKESYILKSAYGEESGTYLISKKKQSNNIVDYFLTLKKLLEKFRILEISVHPSVNTIEIIFSDHDYLIYKPDSLIFKDSENKDFMKYLFKNGKQLDKNWYQFNDFTNTDYY